MDTHKRNRLEDLLIQIQLSYPDSTRGLSSDFEDKFNAICSLIFVDDDYRYLWAEPILLQLDRLFEIKKPNPKRFGEALKQIQERIQIVKSVNTQVD